MQDHADRLIEDYKIDYDELFEPKCIRKEQLEVHLNNKEYGKDLHDSDRPHSAETKMYKVQMAPALRRKNEGIRVWDRVLNKRVTLTIA